MDSFSIVFVCTGNRFRSPLAEAFVRRLTLGLRVSVGSFGLLNLEESPALPEAVELARWCGIDLSRHRTKQLGVEPLADIDVVLGFEQSHVRQAVVDADAPRQHSFTFRELVGLLANVSPSSPHGPVARARAALEGAAELRTATASRPDDISTPDPFGRSWKIYRETAEEIRTLAIALVASLFGVSDTRGLPPLPPKLPRAKASFWWRAPSSRR